MIQIQHFAMVPDNLSLYIPAANTTTASISGACYDVVIHALLQSKILASEMVYSIKAGKNFGYNGLFKKVNVTLCERSASMIIIKSPFANPKP